MTEGDELPGALFELSNKTIAVINDEDPERTKKPHIRRHYRPPPVDDITGKSIFRTYDERVTKEGWHSETYDEIVNQVSETDIYSECAERIEKRTGKSDPEDVLNRFVNKILDENPDSSSARVVSNSIHRFISFIDNSPILWSGTSWVNGFEVEESLRLNEEVSIRPPDEDEDLKIEMPMPVARGNNKNIPTVPNSIIEFEIRTNNSEDLDIMRNKILSTLLLFDVSTIAEVKWETNSNGFDRRLRYYKRYDIEREKLDGVPYETMIGGDQLENLRKFYSVMSGEIEDQIITVDEDDFLTIAFNRYKNAVSDDDSPESQLTSAIMCLEAVLLGDEGELSEKLSRRAGTLLGFFDEHHPLKVKRSIKRAYNIRSRYVHGSKINDEDDVISLSSEIIEYSRRILVIILQMRKEVEKNKLLNKLDRSGLDSDSKDSLKEDLVANCEI
jgi:hypothetical protein